MNRNKIVCPHCGHEYTTEDMESADSCMWAICPNEETAKEVCGACDKTFFIQGGYVPTYDVFKTQDELDCA